MKLLTTGEKSCSRKQNVWSQQPLGCLVSPCAPKDMLTLGFETASALFASSFARAQPHSILGWGSSRTVSSPPEASQGL